LYVSWFVKTAGVSVITNGWNISLMFLMPFIFKFFKIEFLEPLLIKVYLNSNQTLTWLPGLKKFEKLIFNVTYGVYVKLSKLYLYSLTK
jgi:hypothetical protein